MTSIFKIVGVVAVVGVLCVGAVALATDFVWDSNTANTSWLTPANWDQNSSYPQNTNDNATIDDAGYLCTFDPESDLSIKNVTLEGDSPTKRTLHIKTADLTVSSAGFLILNDYADLDIDQDLTAAVTHVSGNVWVDVAAGKIFYTTLDLWAKSSDAVLNLKTAGTMRSQFTWIDAHADSAPRGLKIVGGTYTVKSPLGVIGVIGDLDADNAAKFWLASGTIDFECQGRFTFAGGTTFARRVQVDIDTDLDTSGGQASTQFSGQVSVDIASGKTFNASWIIVKNTAKVKLTGGGTLVSSTQVACQ